MKKFVLIIFLSLLSTFSFAQNQTALNWNDCVKETVKNNPDLAASRQVVQQYQSQKWISASPMLPQISAGSSVNKAYNFSNNQDRNKYDYYVQGEQLIFDGFKTYHDFKAAKEDMSAAQFNSTLTSANIRYNLRKAFVELLQAQAMLPLTQEIIQRRKQNLDMIRLSYKSGREHEGSLLLAEADLKQAEYDLRKAKRDISVAQYALSQVMNQQQNASLKVRGEFTLQKTSTSNPDLKLLADNHPQIQMIKAEKNAAQHSVSSAKAEFFPEVSLNAKAGKVGVGISSDDEGWSVGVGAALPIFEGGRRIANTQKTRAQLREAQHNETSEYNSILSSLEDTWRNLQDTIEETSVQKSYLEAAQMRAKIARAQYANGLLIFDNWIIIEDNYISRQKSYLTSQANMLIAEALWIKTKGEILNYE
ncbi:MAG: TolC family protein [Pseudomonadota bacterium]